MVELRSGRQDRALLFIVWGLTLVVLVLGGLTLSPVLLVWGVIGLPAAILLSYIHIRDTRPPARSASGAPAAGRAAGDSPAGGPVGDLAGGPGGGARPAASDDGIEDGIEEESSR